MIDNPTLPPIQLNKRVDSVDIMRGVTILIMAFVNDLSDFAPVKDVPQWLRHMEPGVDGFTFVDMIVPIFMFVLGISIPLALGKRLKQGDSSLQLAGHILIRTASLVIMGLMDVNRGPGLGRPYGIMLDWPLGLWKFLAWTFILIVWMDIPLKSKLSEQIKRIASIAGLIGLVWLAIVFRDTNGGTFTTSWWGTLGQLGWGYLFASIAWLVFRNNQIGIIGVFVLMLCVYIGTGDGLFQGCWLVDFIGRPALGTYGANAIAGLIIGILITEKFSHKEIIRRALGLALFTGMAAVFLRSLDGLHAPSISWSLFSTSSAFIIWAVLYWCVDVRGWSKGLGHLRSIGKNALLLYMLSRYCIFLYWLTGLTFYEALGENTAAGITRAILYTVFLGVITVMATKNRVRLKV